MAAPRHGTPARGGGTGVLVAGLAAARAEPYTRRHARRARGSAGACGARSPQVRARQRAPPQSARCPRASVDAARPRTEGAAPARSGAADRAGRHRGARIRQPRGRSSRRPRPSAVQSLTRSDAQAIVGARSSCADRGPTVTDVHLSRQPGNTSSDRIRELGPRVDQAQDPPQGAPEARDARRTAARTVATA